MHSWIIFVAIIFEGLLLAIEVWLGVSTGSAWSWASAAFVSVMAGMTLAAYVKS